MFASLWLLSYMLPARCSLKIFAAMICFAFWFSTSSSHSDIPSNYRGLPYRDATHTAGPQAIPGRLEAALFDMGGEGIAYHDTDAANHGSGELNYQPGHCEEGVDPSICHFREHEGVDISYVKKLADFKSRSLVMPAWKQLYIGWEEDGEWTNYTVRVKHSGRYKIIAMYSNVPQTIQFSLNGQAAAACVLPAFPLTHDPAWMVFHTWNRAECGSITLPRTGLQLLTLHYRKGNNLAYFDFVPVD
jgi:hypothetical protein